MTETKPVFEFDRYINGRLMAEGVTIERESDLAAAALVAARIASRGAYGEVTVLVLRQPPAQAHFDAAIRSALSTTDYEWLPIETGGDNASKD